LLHRPYADSGQALAQSCRVNSKQVLRRPIETTRQTGKVAHCTWLAKLPVSYALAPANLATSRR